MPDINKHAQHRLRYPHILDSLFKNFNCPLPEFLRLPLSGRRCQVTGLSRGGMNDLILGPNPPVKSVCLRRPGARRGVRLVVTDDLLRYLYANLDLGKGEK